MHSKTWHAIQRGLEAANREVSDYMKNKNMAEGEASLSRTFKDLFAGAAGGIAQVLLGQLHTGFWFLSLPLFCCGP